MICIGTLSRRGPVLRFLNQVRKALIGFSSVLIIETPARDNLRFSTLIEWMQGAKPDHLLFGRLG
jgi:hypothetical protein